MRYSRNAVYTRVVNAVKAEYPNAYCAGMIEPLPPSFPAVYATEIGWTTPQTNETLEYDSDQWVSTFEVQVYSAIANDAGSEAFAIIDIVKRTMQSLGYLCDMCEPMPNVDTTIFRIIGRWHRQVGGGDAMPTT